MVVQSSGLTSATIGDTVTVEGTVRGYPEKDHIRLEVDDGDMFTRTIVVDRSCVECSCPRGSRISVTGEHDTRLQGPRSARRIETIIRADEILVEQAQGSDGYPIDAL